jgi:hypothetical protein
LARRNPVEEVRSKAIATIDDTVDPFLNEVGIGTPYHNVQDGGRAGGNQDCRDYAEERENDEHLPSNCAPGFFDLLNELHCCPSRSDGKQALVSSASAWFHARVMTAVTDSAHTSAAD